MKDYQETIPDELDMLIQDETGYTEEPAKNKEFYQRTKDNVEWHWNDPLNHQFMNLTPLEQTIILKFNAMIDNEDYANIEDFSVDYGPDYD